MEATWDELYANAADRLARALIALLDEPEAWIQRRVEHVEISSQRLVRRSVTIDLVLPDEAQRARLRLDPDADGSPLVIPLGILRKEQLVDFDLREGSAPLMLVRSGLNARVAAAMIAREASSDGAAPPDVAAALPLFERIAGADAADAQDAFADAFGGGPSGLPLGGTAHRLAERLSDAYVLMVELPETGARHRLVRFATDQIIGLRDEDESVRQRLGLVRTPFDLETTGTDRSASYHAEIVVPAGVVVADAVLLDGADVLTASAQLMGRRAAVYPRGPRGTSTWLHLDLAHERRYFLLPAATVSGVTAIVLLAGAAVTWAGHRPETTASTVVLSGLGVVAGLVVRGDEQPLTSELHGLARFVLTGVLIAAVVAATAVALGASGALLAAFWTGACLISASGAATLAFSTSRAMRGGNAEVVDR